MMKIQKDLKSKPKKSKRLTISSTQEAGTGSSGERRVKTKITPPDATGYVRSNPEGKLTIDTKAVSQENKALKSSVTGLRKERDSLQDELTILKSKLVSLENPGSHPVPGPSKDHSNTDGPVGALSKKPI